MKKLSVLSLLLCLCILLSGCGETVRGTQEYQRMYTIVDDWNKQATPGYEREDLFGYREYLYNSYLLLFPRETPSTLTNYYFSWTPSIDVDDFAIYFTCQLTEDNYQHFIDGLENFSIRKNGETRTLIKDDIHFSYPAYIIQWNVESQKWQSLEYILTDEATHTVICVYTLSAAVIEEEYDVKPHCKLTKVVGKELINDEDHFGYKGFSVYFIEDMEGAQYDLSFLDYLM